MERIIRVYRSLSELSHGVAGEMMNVINKAALSGKRVNIALSGGNTPKTLFSFLGNYYCDSIKWKAVDFFWSDERCVPPHSPESNYRLAKETFLNKTGIYSKNIHRIKGENNPEREAVRYSSEIRKITESAFGIPAFDIIFLGIGEDGHTASLFPGNENVLNSSRICEAVVHPTSGQKRITMTLEVINNAMRIFFLATGLNKAGIVAEVINNPGIASVPASMVNPYNGKVYWFLDYDAASELSQLA